MSDTETLRQCRLVWLGPDLTMAEHHDLVSAWSGVADVTPGPGSTDHHDVPHRPALAHNCP